MNIDDVMPSDHTRCSLCDDTLHVGDVDAHMRTRHGIDPSWTWHAITLIKFGPPRETLGTIEVLAGSKEAAADFVRENEIDALIKVLDHPGRLRPHENSAARFVIEVARAKRAERKKLN